MTSSLRCAHGSTGPRECSLCRAHRPDSIRQGAQLARIGLPDDHVSTRDDSSRDLMGRDKITFAARLQAQFALPYADPGTQTEWTRTLAR